MKRRDHRQEAYDRFLRLIWLGIEVVEKVSNYIWWEHWHLFMSFMQIFLQVLQIFWWIFIWYRMATCFSQWLLMIVNSNFIYRIGIYRWFISTIERRSVYRIADLIFPLNSNITPSSLELHLKWWKHCNKVQLKKIYEKYEKCDISSFAT